jgi:hypothetical protein
MAQCLRHVACAREPVGLPIPPSLNPFHVVANGRSMRFTFLCLRAGLAGLRGVYQFPAGMWYHNRHHRSVCDRARDLFYHDVKIYTSALAMYANSQ